MPAGTQSFDTSSHTILMEALAIFLNRKQKTFRQNALSIKYANRTSKLSWIIKKVDYEKKCLMLEFGNENILSSTTNNISETSEMKPPAVKPFCQLSKFNP